MNSEAISRRRGRRLWRRSRRPSGCRPRSRSCRRRSAVAMGGGRCRAARARVSEAAHRAARRRRRRRRGTTRQRRPRRTPRSRRARRSPARSAAARRSRRPPSRASRPSRRSRRPSRRSPPGPPRTGRRSSSRPETTTRSPVVVPRQSSPRRPPRRGRRSLPSTRRTRRRRHPRRGRPLLMTLLGKLLLPGNEIYDAPVFRPQDTADASQSLLGAAIDPASLDDSLYGDSVLLAGDLNKWTLVASSVPVACCCCASVFASHFRGPAAFK
mmetsp:Transcript_3706/g.14520  ORF Transcript_3706/g.14520 Transcript_3706/m.14520 type:complete len:269 (-) Transcript_3706:23-829(-)